MAALRLEGVAKRFGTVSVVEDVDLDVADGEFVVFVGPSGCGKSTLLRMIAGLESVSAGNVYIGNADVSDVAAAQRGLAMVFQSYALYPHMTVRQNLAFGLQNLRTAPAEIESRVGKASAMLRLDTLLDRRPTQLSGGQRQRVAIGRAIVREPSIFLFDEPLSNLDAELRVAMRAEITALHARLGTTMIYVTHDQVEAMTMANRIVVLRAGRVEQVGTPLELYLRPRNRFVAGFIGSPQMNFLAGRVVSSDDGHIRIGIDAVPGWLSPPIAALTGATAGTPIDVGIRPEHVERGVPAGDHAEVTSTVSRLEELGALSVLYCALPNDEPLTVQIAGHANARAGDSVTIRLPVAAIRCFERSDRALALT